MRDSFGVEFETVKGDENTLIYGRARDGEEICSTIDAGSTRELWLLTLLLNARSVPEAISGELQSQRMRPRSS